jgi:hypothetical protein
MMFKWCDVSIMGEVVAVTGFVPLTCTLTFIFQLVNIIATILNGIAG